MKIFDCSANYGAEPEDFYGKLEGLDWSQYEQGTDIFQKYNSTFDRLCFMFKIAHVNVVSKTTDERFVS